MSIFSKFFKQFLGKKSIRLLVVGLDGGGKSSIINLLKPKKATAIEVVPTVGFAIEEFTKNNINFSVFDMSGQSKWRSLWEHHYGDTQAIIWVIDSGDRFRMVVVKDELKALLNSKVLKAKNIPILFFANKKDMSGALSPVEICSELELNALTDRTWHITASNGLTGEGLEDGLQWLTSQIH